MKKTKIWIKDIDFIREITDDEMPDIMKTRPHTKRALKSLMEISDYDISCLYSDYDKLKGIYMEGNPVSYLLGGFIEEGLIRTLDAEVAFRYVKDFFNIPDSSIVIYKIGRDERGKIISLKKEMKNGRFFADKGFDENPYDETISVLLCNVKNNVQNVVNAMNLCGYFLSRPKQDEVPPNEWMWFRFEKRNQNSYSKQLRLQTDRLYHVTPIERVEKILANGFTPKSSNEFFSYPGRVFFFNGAEDKLNVLEWAVKLLQSVIRKEYNKELQLLMINGVEKNPYSHSHNLKKLFALMTINLRKVPEGVRFFMDSNAYGGVFTEDNLYPQVISNIEVYELDVIKNRVEYKGTWEDYNEELENEQQND